MCTPLVGRNLGLETLRLATRTREALDGGGERVAGLSSFGIHLRHRLSEHALDFLLSAQPPLECRLQRRVLSLQGVRLLLDLFQLGREEGLAFARSMSTRLASLRLGLRF